MQKILIIDDNKDFAELLETIFHSNGYETFVTYDGLQAIDHLKENNSYDLIITDIIMPNNDGFDVINYAKANTNAKIIAISGGGILLSAQSAVDAITEQVDACLEKPIKMAKLLECVQDTLK